MNGRGTFIAFEGGDGAGKSTQIAALRATLEAAGHQVTVTREPGGSALGQQIRKMLLDPNTGGIHPRTEALLFAADRAEHVATVIRPALEAGHVVITDRYMDSSAAYQGAGRGLSREEVLGLSMWGTDNLVPDLTIILDLDPEVGAARATKVEFGQPDRFESEALTFASAVREGFLSLADRDPDRYWILDASENPTTIAAEVGKVVGLLLRVEGLVAAS